MQQLQDNMKNSTAVSSQNQEQFKEHNRQTTDLARKLKEARNRTASLPLHGFFRGE